MTTIYKDKNRLKDSNESASQSETPGLKIINNDLHITGYQNFIINNNNIIYKSKKTKYTIIENLLKQLKNECDSITDIGCSNGIISFIGNKYNYNILSLDHDINCIDLINTIVKQLDINNISCKKYSFGEKIDQASDIVTMFALIHWIYSCTDINGNFDKIFKYINPYIKKYLLIEWVDPNDIAIQTFNHINYNTNIQTEEYNILNFEKSLVKNIGQINKKITLDGSTRILYIIKKI